MTVTDARLEDIDLLAATWGKGVPHDQFDRLRAQAPVFWHPEADGPGFWALTKHADVRAASHDHEMFSSELGRHVHPHRRTRRRWRRCASRSSTWTRPKHHRYRRLVSKGFTPRMITPLVEEIERRAAVVIDDVCEKGEVEFVEEIAAQVPMQMICEMIGLEPEVWPRMFELSNQLIGSRDDPDYQELPGGPKAAADGGLHAVRRGGRRPPRQPARRHHDRARAGRDRRRAARRLRAQPLLHHPDRGRQRDHPEPHQPLHARPHRPPRPGPAAARRPVAVGHRRRRDAPLGQLDPQLPPHRHPRHRAARRADQAGRQGRPVLRGRQPRRGGLRRSRTGSTSAARPTTTSPSAAAGRTTASAPASPRPRSRRRCARSSTASPTSSWPARSTACTPTSSTASRRCPSASPPPPPSRKD